MPPDADISFEDGPAVEPAAAEAERKIKYYRNPMGLPDTSPTPKKDAMGMDYIPVYEGDDSDDGSVKLSPGKIQRTGVKSEPAARRVIRTTIRAPGHDPARRASDFGHFNALRKLGAEGRRRHHGHARSSKGQPLMEIYSPAISSAAAEYIATIAFQGNRR